MAGWWIKFEAETGRRFYKIVLVVNGDIYIILLIYESRTQPLYYDRQYGWYKGTADRPQWETDCMEQSAYGEDDRSLAGHKFGQLNNIWWTVQTVMFLTHQHLPLVLPVCPLLQTTYTYHVHSTRRQYALSYRQYSTTSYRQYSTTSYRQYSTTSFSHTICW